MKYFEFNNSVCILCGKNSLEKLPIELERYSCKNAMLLSGPVLTKIGLVDKIKNCFNKSNIEINTVYNNIPNDSSLEVVNNIAKLYNENKCDCIIAAGGGSVLDTAKAVKLLLTYGGNNIKDYVGMDGIFKKEKDVPFVAIPTTSGTGSEVTKVAVILDTEKNIKMEFVNKDTLPNIAVLDPSTTVTLPQRSTFTSAMDALTHAIEAFTGTQAQPLTNMFAIKAIQLIFDNIDKAIEKPNNLETRLNMLKASTLAGIAFSNSMVGVVHAIGHAIGGVSHLAHDQAMAILLPHCMRFNYDKLKDKYAKLLYYITDENTYRNIKDEDKASETINIIDKLINKYHDKLGIYKTLSEAGVKEEQINEIVEKSLRDGAILANVKTIEKHEVKAILEKAF